MGGCREGRLILLHYLCHVLFVPGLDAHGSDRLSAICLYTQYIP